VVRDAALKLVKEYGTAAQATRYRGEIAKRDAFARQSAVRGLIARLDRVLMLTEAQRAGLLEFFESNWKDEWGAMWAGLPGEDDGAPFPAIPDRLILPRLSAAQQKIWKRLEKQSLEVSAAHVEYVTEVMDGLPSEFAEWLDAGAAQTRKPAEAKAAPDLKKSGLK
jgi:hypothetical protein